MPETAATGTSEEGLSSATPERRLAAILAADVAGYSRVMAANAIAARHGRIVGTAGDSVLAEFRSPVEAVECAAAVQKELGRRNAALPERQRMEFRIGINLGDVIVDGDQIYGDGVNVAARLEGLADAGAICVSSSVVEQVHGKVPYWFDDLGPQQVKNIPGRVR